MKMVFFNKNVLLVICVQIACGFCLIQLRNECPSVEVDPNANATDYDCMPCFDCGFALGSMCCPNKCGSWSCTFVANPCTYDYVQYNHHQWMPLPNNWVTDNCGDCWCQNGEKRCVTYSCKTGPRP